MRVFPYVSECFLVQHTEINGSPGHNERGDRTAELVTNAWRLTPVRQDGAHAR